MVERIVPRLVLAFVLGFAALKLAEAIVPLESFPFTRAPMFAEYRGPDQLPWKVRLFGRRDGRDVELRESDFGLDSNEYVAALIGRIDDLAAACGELGRAYNARVGDRRRLESLAAYAFQIRRPAVGLLPESRRVACPLDGAP